MEAFSTTETNSCSQIEFYINIFCIKTKTEKQSTEASIACITFMLILLFLMIKLSYSTRFKISKMKQININEPIEEQTYCNLSVVIVNLIMLLDIIAIIYVILTIYMFAVGDNFAHQFLSKSITNCHQSKNIPWH